MQKNVRDRPDRKARELLDLPMRFEGMQATNVDSQVVYPTLFLAYLTHDAAYEVELCKAYNRFLADVWAKAEDRIRYVVIPPLRNIDATISELRFGKEHGACGVFFRGIEGDKTLDDPYFFPVYEEAQSLGLPICIHQGQGAPALNYLIDVSRSHTFTHGAHPARRRLPQPRLEQGPGALPRPPMGLHRDRRFLGAVRDVPAARHAPRPTRTSGARASSTSTTCGSPTRSRRTCPT